MRFLFVMVLLAGLISLGCDSDSPAETEAPAEAQVEGLTLQESAQQLGAIRAQGPSGSAALEAWMEEQGLSDEELEELLFEIASDVEASRIYSESE